MSHEFQLLQNAKSGLELRLEEKEAVVKQLLGSQTQRMDTREDSLSSVLQGQLKDLKTKLEQQLQ